VDLPGDSRLFVFVEPSVVKNICQYIFRDLDARYVISIGIGRPAVFGQFHGGAQFRIRPDHLLCSVLTYLPSNNPKVDSISDVVPAANWAEREMRDLVGIEPVGHRYLKRLVLPDGWPEGVHPLRKDLPGTGSQGIQ
jgi:Ni,Fe-hydrogenase III component G